MKILRTIAALALLAPFAALAQNEAQSQNQYQGGYSRLSYTYADGRLVIADYDRGGSADGIRIAGSVQFQPELFATGALTALNSDGFDYNQLDFGLGLRHPLQGNVDLVGIIGLVFADVDGGGDDTGISLTGGVRAPMSSQFELGGYVSYVEIFDDGDITLTGEGLLHLNPNLSLVGSLGFSDNVTTITAGARWNFGRARGSST